VLHRENIGFSGLCLPGRTKRDTPGLTALYLAGSSYTRTSQYPVRYYCLYAGLRSTGYPMVASDHATVKRSSMYRVLHKTKSTTLEIPTPLHPHRLPRPHSLHAHLILVLLLSVPLSAPSFQANEAHSWNIDPQNRSTRWVAGRRRDERQAKREEVW
jgi:hypothetical protein